MGVIYLLVYIFGSLSVWLGSRNVISAALDGESILGAMQFVGFGVWMIVLAAILHAVVLKRREDAGVLEGLNPSRWKLLIGGMLAWWVPTVAAWIQFELYIDPIRMFPFVTVVGAGAVVLWLAFRVLPQTKMMWPLATVAVTLLGIPLGLLTVSVPIKHFNHHLSSVKIRAFENSGYARSYEGIIAAHDDTYIGGPAPLIGEEGLGVLGELADAREVDVEAEIAAGRLREAEDGTLIKINEDGSEEKVGTLETFDDVFQEALEADRKVASEEEARKRAAWEAEMEERRRGGRFLGLREAPAVESADAS
ncbi:hypothetical protein DL240_18665 [Lujinxingia litoralis]|uniref:Uncharacterized protein n=1 Tax=Lujinxingia litoralis TaxID=2211119 RepID=A0A328C152_9DELT|nr:hypothetical protein [Lujinxingia litoralis]RAL20133.1 hypothetical protein DL240_18665 [Lujinxingia litoralis]